MTHVNTIIRREVFTNVFLLGGIVTLMLLIVLFDVISPWPFEILIDDVLAAVPQNTGGIDGLLYMLFHSRSLLGFFAVFVYFSSTFGLALVEYLNSIFTKRVIKNITTDFSKEAFKNIQTLAIGFFSKQKIGDYIYRLGYDVSAVGELLENGILPLITSSIYLIITISIMFFIDVKLTILSVAVLPFLTIGLYSFNRRITRATKRSEFFNSVAYSFIEETLNHLKVIQAFSQENKKTDMFERRMETSLRNDTTVFRLDFMLSLIVGSVIAISYSLVMLYGIQAVFAGTLTTGLLIVFIFYLDNLTNPIISIIYAATEAREAYIKIQRMEDFFATRSHLDYHKGKVKEFHGTDIRFEHVTLLGDKGEKILHNVSFTIESGKRTVIFGTNGSGKTSLINLLMRFIDQPSSGGIFIGGIPLEEYDIKSLRDNIAYVPQEITLFNDTIRNNIVFGNTHHAMENVRRAAKLSTAESFIKQLPGSYEFRVGENGNFLSGGQRQRLMIARALMKEHAKMLIFDEAFSALDVQTRQHALEYLYEFSVNKTTVLISNIFDVINAAENVVVLNHGKLLYAGASKRLPKEISLYKMLSDKETSEESPLFI